MAEQTYYDIVLLPQKTKNNSALYSSFILLKLVEYSQKRSTPLKSEIYGSFFGRTFLQNRHLHKHITRKADVKNENTYL